MKKILIVDDDAGILDAVSLILEEMGFIVATLSRGEEACEKVISFLPDVILLDLLMSGSDGRDICQNLKQNHKTKNIPVIMISAHPSAQKAAAQAGAQDFLAKPFDASDLLAKIDTCLVSYKGA